MHLKKNLIFLVLNFISLNANFYSNFRNLIRSTAITKLLQYSPMKHALAQKRFLLPSINRNFYSYNCPKINYTEFAKIDQKTNDTIHNALSVGINEDDEVVKYNFMKLNPNFELKYPNLYVNERRKFVKFLMANQIYINRTYGIYTLYHAVINSDVEYVLLLLKLGANINESVFVYGEEYKIIDFANKQIKNVLDMHRIGIKNIEKYEALINTIDSGNLSVIKLDFLEYVVKYKDFNTIQKVFNNLKKNWVLIDKPEIKCNLKSLAKERGQQISDFINNYISSDEDFLKHY